MKEGSKKEENMNKKKITPKINISNEIQNLVKYLYREATDSLLSNIKANISSNGIETPLGILTFEQIKKGEEC